MTNDQIMQMEEAKLVAEQEARTAVNQARQYGEKDPAVLKQIEEETYRQMLAQELGVEEQ